MADEPRNTGTADTHGISGPFTLNRQDDSSPAESEHPDELDVALDELRTLEALRETLADARKVAKYLDEQLSDALFLVDERQRRRLNVMAGGKEPDKPWRYTPDPFRRDARNE